MRILVIDVAAEHSGAVTILNQFIEKFQADNENEYIIALSNLKYEDKTNIHFVNFKWVKKTRIHRIWFDKVYCRKLIREYRPDKVLSLQNSAVSVNGIEQDVYFHNALPISDYRISFSQSKSIWIYQNIIGWLWKKSLKHATHVYVQAEWVKKTLVKKWKLNEERISVERPNVSMNVDVINADSIKCEKGVFYPANGSVYKNHITLLKAMISVWTQKNTRKPELFFTGKLSDLPMECQTIIKHSEYPIHFLGRITKDQMIYHYRNNVLVFPSIIETVGLPLLEAKILGCGIIASDCEYAREAIGEYEKAKFFSPHDDKQLGQLILDFFSTENQNNRDE